MRRGADRSRITDASRFIREKPDERRTEMTFCTANGPLDDVTCISDFLGSIHHCACTSVAEGACAFSPTPDAQVLFVALDSRKRGARPPVLHDLSASSMLLRPFESLLLRSLLRNFSTFFTPVSTYRRSLGQSVNNRSAKSMLSIFETNSIFRTRGKRFDRWKYVNCSDYIIKAVF